MAIPLAVLHLIYTQFTDSKFLVASNSVFQMFYI